MLLVSSLNRDVNIYLDTVLVYENLPVVWYREPNQEDVNANFFIMRIANDNDSIRNFFIMNYQKCEIKLVGENPRYKIVEKKEHQSPLKMFNRFDLLVQKTSNT